MSKALFRAHFNPRLAALAKMSLGLAQNIFITANKIYISIVLFVTTAKLIG